MVPQDPPRTRIISSCITLPRPLVPSYLVSLAPSGTNYRTYARSPPSLTDSVAERLAHACSLASSQVLADLATIALPTLPPDLPAINQMTRLVCGANATRRCTLLIILTKGLYCSVPLWAPLFRLLGLDKRLDGRTNAHTHTHHRLEEGQYPPRF